MPASVSVVTAAAPAAPFAATTPAPLTHHPLCGVIAVLMGALISTINTRLRTVGLADVRGGDWSGVILVGGGPTFIHAALDQGNRLDRLGSGTGSCCSSGRRPIP